MKILFCSYILKRLLFRVADKSGNVDVCKHSGLHEHIIQVANLMNDVSWFPPYDRLFEVMELHIPKYCFLFLSALARLGWIVKQVGDQ